MSQISPPIRILLVLTVAVLGVYMLFLRPKPEEATPVEPAGTTATQPETVDAGETATGTAPAAAAEKVAPKAGAAAKPADDLKGLPKPVRKAIRGDKVLVILFADGKSADDRAVAGAMKKVDDWNGRVFTHTAPLTRISRWGRIARGVNVEQSPTVVVVDRDLRAEALVGFVDRTTIDQAVVDALRSDSGVFTSSYLRKVDALCVEMGNKAASMPHYYLATATVPQFDQRLSRYHTLASDFSAEFAAIKPPKKYAAFHRASVADHKATVAQIAAFSAAVTPKSSKAEVRAVAQRYDNRAGRARTKRYDARADALGLYRCGSHF